MEGGDSRGFEEVRRSCLGRWVSVDGRRSKLPPNVRWMSVDGRALTRWLKYNPKVRWVHASKSKMSSRGRGGKLLIKKISEVVGRGGAVDRSHRGT